MMECVPCFLFPICSSVVNVLVRVRFLPPVLGLVECIMSVNFLFIVAV